ncbi:MAG: hypothetical protein K0R71_824 [Bacillales bacterium]|jgi:predicted transcriptional regulator|nr:hypothetical protein [Bacillales bacterium]
MTKHEQILQYISSLPIGEKISVRSVAKELHVSEGTAYNAIKDAENKGIAMTIERVGTIRIERKRKENIEHLTFAEVVKIVNGQVVAGKSGLHMRLNNFVIGAMEIEAMVGYIHKSDLLIVGNRSDAHDIALKMGAAVLITGGFHADPKTKKLADELNLPIIVSKGDTYSVAKMINRAIYDLLIKKDILLVEDVAEKITRENYLVKTDEISKWHERNIETKHTRFPVVDEQMKLVGIATSSDILGQSFDVKIENVMTKKAKSIQGDISVAAAAHLMLQENVEILPVVDERNRLVSVLRKKAVNSAIHFNHRQMQETGTIEDIIAQAISLKTDSADLQPVYQMMFLPQFANYNGSISYGVITSVLTEVANREFRKLNFTDLMLDNMTIYFLKTMMMNAQMEIVPAIFEIERNSGKMDIEIKSAGELVGKAMLSCRILEKKNY